MYVGQIDVKDYDNGENGRVELKIAPPMDKYVMPNERFLRDFKSNQIVIGAEDKPLYSTRYKKRKKKK